MCLDVLIVFVSDRYCRSDEFVPFCISGAFRRKLTLAIDYVVYRLAHKTTQRERTILDELVVVLP